MTDRPYTAVAFDLLTTLGSNADVEWHMDAETARRMGREQGLSEWQVMTSLDELTVCGIPVVLSRWDEPGIALRPRRFGAHEERA